MSYSSSACTSGQPGPCVATLSSAFSLTHCINFWDRPRTTFIMLFLLSWSNMKAEGDSPGITFCVNFSKPLSISKVAKIKTLPSKLFLSLSHCKLQCTVTRGIRSVYCSLTMLHFSGLTPVFLLFLQAKNLVRMNLRFGHCCVATIADDIAQ